MELWAVDVTYNTTPGMKNYVDDNAAEVDPKLISSACDNCKGGQMCVTWLQDNENDQELVGIDKTDMRNLAFFSLKKVEKEAVTVSEAVEMKLSNGSEKLPPMTQQGLSDCHDHYIPAVDLIEDTVDSIAFKRYAEAIKFLKASTLDLIACQKSLAKLQTDAATGKPTKADEHATMAINHRDVLASHVTIAQCLLDLAAKDAGAGGAGAPAADPPS
nr:cell wall / vacuolar inhibitor of fructosidase 2-like [Ipomoea batatas]